jgi:hypothetical protein
MFEISLREETLSRLAHEILETIPYWVSERDDRRPPSGDDIALAAQTEESS